MRSNAQLIADLEQMIARTKIMTGKVSQMNDQLEKMSQGNSMPKCFREQRLVADPECECVTCRRATGRP